LPRSTEFATQTPDFFSENVWRPVFGSVSGILSRVRGLQHGRVQIYVLYVVLTLLVLLVWGLR
jgi:hydrogenase-4 component B